MSLAGFNPDVSLLTAHPNAQMHVFSGGGNIVLDKNRVENMLKLVGLDENDISAIKGCTGDYDNISFSNPECDVIDYQALYNKIKAGSYSGLLDENNEGVLKSLVDAVAPIPEEPIAQQETPLASWGDNPLTRPGVYEKVVAAKAAADQAADQAAAKKSPGMKEFGKGMVGSMFSPPGTTIKKAAGMKGGSKKSSRRTPRKLRYNRKKATARTRARTTTASRK